MNEMKGEEGKNMRSKGITLIALVITIIVLLILAAVSIATLTGDNGILNRAQEAKEKTEEAKQKENALLSEYEKEIDLAVEGSIGIQEAQNKSVMMAKTKNTWVKDEYNNIFKVPAGFFVTTDTKKVNEGIVIEDKEGNQYVWVPIGDVYINEEKEIKTIDLGRYVFKEDGSINKELSVTEPNERLRVNSSSQTYYIEETVEQQTEHIGALNIENFINSSIKNGGYYIARYEASEGINEKADSKIADSWRLTYNEAINASRNIYNSDKYVTDLVNSYAWDTAIVFIQEFSEEKNYSIKTSVNSTINKTGNNGDEVCNINDLSSNFREWITEKSSYNVNGENFSYVRRGGFYFISTNYTSERGSLSGEDIISFRTVLYFN